MVGTLIRRPLPPVSDFIRTLLDDPDATTALATLGITSGIYTPTLFNTTNLTASTSYLATWLRVGDRVTVAGFVDVDPTAGGGAVTTLGISLPVASAFTTGLDCLGTGTAYSFVETYSITADFANDRARLDWVAQSTAANHPVTFIFMYRVL